jgi:iron complex transport system ATP-binding protein
MALHEINLAFGFDRVVLVKEGAVLADGGPREVLTEGFLKDAFGIGVKIRQDGQEPYVSYGG